MKVSMKDSLKLKATLVAVLSVLLLYLPVAPAVAASAAAKMTTAGTAKLNGAVAPALTSVFSGDRIATGQDARTTLSFAGGSAVVIPQMSRVKLGMVGGHPMVNLESGTLTVLSKSGGAMVIIADGARITAAKSAVYDVTVRGNVLRVVAREGEARVESANRSGNVSAGNALSATLSPNQGQAPGAAGNSLFSSTDWAIVGISAGAAAGLGVGLYEAEKGSSASPSVN
jgi:ferric-dicitrate binding protein FerR (iron transport regulator)